MKGYLILLYNLFSDHYSNLTYKMKDKEERMTWIHLIRSFFSFRLKTRSPNRVKHSHLYHLVFNLFLNSLVAVIEIEIKIDKYPSGIQKNAGSTTNPLESRCDPTK